MGLESCRSFPLDQKVQPPAADGAVHSGAANWGALHPFIEWEARIAQRAEQGRISAFIYEFIRFGVKQAWACLFGGVMIALLIATWLWYPKGVALARYDFLFLAALAVQALMLAFRLETWEEAKVIFIYHIVGTAMEIFKTAVGSWIYPEDNLFRIGGVPLFTGFMYASVGSFIARVWRLCDFRFSRHPPQWQVMVLAAAMYVNFFAHHYMYDLRWILLALAVALFSRTWIYYKVWKVHRRMPLLVACGLAAIFIWFAENIGTYTNAWLYPNQLRAWSLVSFSKLSSWYMLLIVSYALVMIVARPQAWTGESKT